MNKQELAEATSDIVSNAAGIETIMVVAISWHFFGTSNEEFINTFYPVGRKSRVIQDFFNIFPDGQLQQKVERIMSIRNIFAHSVFASDGPPNEAESVQLARLSGGGLEKQDPEKLYEEYKELTKASMPELQRIAEESGLEFEPLK